MDPFEVMPPWFMVLLGVGALVLYLAGVIHA